MSASVVVLLCVTWTGIASVAAGPSTDMASGDAPSSDAPAATPEAAGLAQDDSAIASDTPEPDEPTVDMLIANAERLLEKQKHALALEQVRIVLDEGGLSRELHARARLVEARALAKTATSEEAVAALATAFALGATPPRPTDLLESALLDAARAGAAKNPLVARAERSALSRSGAVVTLIADAQGLTAGVRVTWPSTPSTPLATAASPKDSPEPLVAPAAPVTLPLTREAPVAFVPFADDGREPALALVDARGNTLLALELVAQETRAAEAVTSLTVANMPWLTVLGGSVMLAGAVGIATAGTLAALSDKGSSVVTPDLKLPLLVGVGVAALVAAVGAALVLGDQLLLAPGRVDDKSPPDGP
jgi:hypothetical protein